MTNRECALAEFLLGTVSLGLGLYMNPAFLIFAPIAVALGVLDLIV